MSSDEYIVSCEDEYGNLQTKESGLEIKRVGVFQITPPTNTPKGTEIEVLFRNTGNMLEVSATLVESGCKITECFKI